MDISTEFVSENLCGSASKENNLITPLNTDTPKFSDNSTIPSVLTDFNTPQLANSEGKSNTNQVTKIIEAQLIAMTLKSLILIKNLTYCMSVLMA